MTRNRKSFYARERDRQRREVRLRLARDLRKAESVVAGHSQLLTRAGALGMVTVLALLLPR